MAPKKRKQWSQENMRDAILAVRGKEMGLSRASKLFDVPKSTLKDKVNSREEDVDKLVATKLGRKSALGDEIEEALVRYALEMEARFYGLTAKDIKRMAFELAEKNGKCHPFSKGEEAAGWKWLRSFMKRHPQLSLRKPQATSLGRIRGFTQENVNLFFDIFEPLMDVIKHSPNRLYNCDETGLTVVQHKVSRVVSVKGKRQVGAVSSAERGSLVTVVTCMNASGHYVPPLLVFPRVNMKPELLDGTPNGSIAVCHKSGWIQMDSFLQWFQQQFLAIVKPNKEDPVILVLDGHYSHTRNLQLLELARENGVHIVCLPPHCTHKMQPLDAAFMLPLKTYYAQAIETWLKQNVGRVVTHYQVGRLLGEAYNKAATVATATSGFKKTGLFPCNRNIFGQHEFVSELNSSPLYDDKINKPHTTPSLKNKGNQSLGLSTASRSIQQELHKSPSDICSSPQPSTSMASGILVGPADISPVPSLKSNQTKTSRGRGRPTCPAAVLTSSPYKNKLSDDVKNISMKGKTKQLQMGYKKNIARGKKRSCETGKTLNKKDSVTDKSNKQKKRKTKISLSSESSEEEMAEPLTVSTDEEDSDDEDCVCPYCNQLYSQDRQGEKWVLCTKCRIWCHEECSGTDDYTSFICDFCLEG